MFISMCTCICVRICVYAYIAFALQLLCICICVCIGQATKASCKGLQNDACQDIGMPDCKSKRVNNFLHHFRIMSRGFKKSRQAASQHVALTSKFVSVGHPRPLLMRFGYASHAQPFWLGSRWYNLAISQNISSEPLEISTSSWRDCLFCEDLRSSCNPSSGVSA